jgi:hypothetical protein
VNKEGFQEMGDKLDEARKEIVGEIRSSKDEMVNELRELRRIESDISQIKAKTGL